MFRRSDIIALLDGLAVDAIPANDPVDPISEAAANDTEPILAEIARAAGVTRCGAARLRKLR